MATIATYTLASFGLMMQAGVPRPIVETERREGVDGVLAHTLAKAPRPVQGPTTADVATHANASTLADTYRALIGTTVTVVDQFGVSYTGVTVQDCVPEIAQTLTAWRVTAQWTLLVA
jgi:hypothetical protein